MCKIGLIDFLRQTGTVKLHPQNSLSNETYRELQSARKMIKNYIKDYNIRIDIYDANTLPKEKGVYGNFPNQVRVEINHLLDDEVVPRDFHENNKNEPILRQIFKFVDEECGQSESPLQEMINKTRRKYCNYIKRNKTNQNDRKENVEKTHNIFKTVA